MKLKEILLGLVLGASTLSGDETLQELVKRKGLQINYLNASGTYAIIYSPGFEESVRSNTSRIQISLVEDPLVKNYMSLVKNKEGKYATTIAVYSAKGRTSDRLIIWDNNSDRKFDPNEDCVIFEGRDPKSFRTVKTLEESKDIFNQVYDLAESYCGLNKEEKEQRKYTSTTKPVNS